MSRQIITTEPVEVAWNNPKRKKWLVQYLPAGTVATNTGKIYLKRGSAPSADINSSSWDSVLVPGAMDGDNIDDVLAKCPYTGSVWMISDTADQVVDFQEINMPETPPEAASG